MDPPPLRMRIIHPLLPWTIHVDAGPGQVVTVSYLIHSLYQQLHRQVLTSDFWNDVLNEDDRRRIYAAWGSRCKGNQKLAEQGLKRVDFLGDMFMFQGLKKVGDSWEMKLKSGQNSF